MLHILNLQGETIATSDDNEIPPPGSKLVSTEIEEVAAHDVSTDCIVLSRDRYLPLDPEDRSAPTPSSSLQRTRSTSPKSLTSSNLQGSWNELESKWKKQPVEQQVVTPISSNITNLVSKEDEPGSYSAEIIVIDDAGTKSTEEAMPEDADAKTETIADPMEGQLAYTQRPVQDEKNESSSIVDRVDVRNKQEETPNYVGVRCSRQHHFVKNQAQLSTIDDTQYMLNDKNHLNARQQTEEPSSRNVREEDSRISRRRRIRENLSRIESLQARRRQLHAERSLNQQYLSADRTNSAKLSAANSGSRYLGNERQISSQHSGSDEERRTRISELSKRRNGVRASRHRFAHAVKDNTIEKGRSSFNQGVYARKRDQSAGLAEGGGGVAQKPIRVMPASLKLEIGARVARQRNEKLQKEMRRKRFNRSVHSRPSVM